MAAGYSQAMRTNPQGTPTTELQGDQKRSTDHEEEDLSLKRSEERSVVGVPAHTTERQS